MEGRSDGISEIDERWRLADPSTLEARRPFNEGSSSDAGIESDEGGRVGWWPGGLWGFKILRQLHSRRCKIHFPGGHRGASGKMKCAIFSVKLAWESGSIMPFCGCGLFLPPSCPVNGPFVLEHAGASKGRKVKWMDRTGGWKSGGARGRHHDPKSTPIMPMDTPWWWRTPCVSPTHTLRMWGLARRLVMEKSSTQAA